MRASTDPRRQAEAAALLQQYEGEVEWMLERKELLAAGWHPDADSTSAIGLFAQLEAIRQGASADELETLGERALEAQAAA